MKQGLNIKVLYIVDITGKKKFANHASNIIPNNSTTNISRTDPGKLETVEQQ